MATTSPRRLIDSRGGYAAVADALGWPYSTVHTWYRANAMPTYRRPFVESLPPKKKVERAPRQRPIKRRAA